MEKGAGVGNLAMAKARRLQRRPLPMTPGSRSAPIGRRPRGESRRSGEEGEEAASRAGARPRSTTPGAAEPAGGLGLGGDDR